MNSDTTFRITYAILCVVMIIAQLPALKSINKSIKECVLPEDHVYLKTNLGCRRMVIAIIVIEVIAFLVIIFA